jgi:hypothetical protein
VVTVQQLDQTVLSAVGEWNKRAAGFHDALWLRPDMDWVGESSAATIMFTDLRPAELRT